ncbi:MAG TPA: YidC/Oxa1 family insertase periplasmic-domain containing protein [Tepidisphaeraceae bacterium]|nr:YidC/Oxa1 family insertase periplasmic-domain containing protein [Tepidisphaeraceae bacterium]
MDTKRLVLGMSLAMAVMLGWTMMISYLDKQNPEWGLVKRETVDQQTSPTTAPAAVPSNAIPTTAAVGTAPMAVSPAVPATAATGATVQAGLHAIPATQPTPVTLGSADKNDPNYAVALELSPVGAAVDSVTLNGYKRVVNSDERYTFQQPYKGFEDKSRTLATQWISVDGVKVDLNTVPWSLQSSTRSSAVYSVDLADANGPVVRVLKTFTITDKTAEKDNAAGYEVKVDFAIANLANRPLVIASAFNGTTAPENENDRMPDQQSIAGYLNQGFITLQHELVTYYTPSKPTRDLTSHPDGYPLAWVGMGSGYFNALLRPEPATGAVNGPYISKVTATALDPAATDYHHDVVLTLETQPVTLPAGTSVNMPLRAFFFPKQRDLLGNAYMIQAPLSFDKTLVMTSGFCSICTFQWIIDLLVGMLKFFHSILFDWGLAIIALVCVVRALLHPITKKSQVSMMKMGKMGPEMERLKKKHGDDKEALNRAMMQFYKEQGATPILGCLPMFLQMPIWIALYTALQSTFELRQSPFLQFAGIKLTWIEDLAHPDRLFYFPNHPIDLYFFKVDAFNVLPFLLAVVFFLQTKYTPKPPATTPEQVQQQKMMQWMTLIFPVFLYNGPAGLNLYILTSTTIGIIESKIIRKHIKQKEEAEAAAAVVIDIPDKKDDRRDPPPKGGVRRVEPTKPAGGLGGWFANLQARAEELKREAEKRKR